MMMNTEEATANKQTTRAWFKFRDQCEVSISLWAWTTCDDVKGRLMCDRPAAIRFPVDTTRSTMHLCTPEGVEIGARELFEPYVAAAGGSFFRVTVDAVPSTSTDVRYDQSEAVRAGLARCEAIATRLDKESMMAMPCPMEEHTHVQKNGKASIPDPPRSEYARPLRGLGQEDEETTVGTNWSLDTTLGPSYVDEWPCYPRSYSPPVKIQRSVLFEEALEDVD